MQLRNARHAGILFGTGHIAQALGFKLLLVAIMFFSVQHLVGPDAKFALVWRAATCGSAMKLPRKAILEVSVPNMCREILNFTPEAHDRVSAKKFSLYLLGQLLYGTVLIYDRQLTLFHTCTDVPQLFELFEFLLRIAPSTEYLHAMDLMRKISGSIYCYKEQGLCYRTMYKLSTGRFFGGDARMACENCRRLRMEELLPKPSKGAPTSAKKGRRARVVESRISGIDVTEQPEGRFVGLARRDEITMVESQPIIWKREDLFQEETVQAPVHFSRERFIDWNDERTSSSKESMKTLAEANKEPATLEAASVSYELPPFPPPKAFQNMDRESFLAGTQPVLDAGHGLRRGSVTNEGSIVDAQPPNEYQPVPKKPRLDSGGPMTTSGENDRESLVPSLELPPLNDNLEVVQPSRRRKPLQSIDTNSLTIPYVSMKEMQEDYSSLLKTPEELRITVDKHPTLHELLLPYPAYAGKRFPKACIGLYRSRYSDTMTFKETTTGNLNEPARGVATDSSKERSDQRHASGIAYVLYPTPPRVRGAAAHLGNPSGERAHNLDQSSVLSTPGIFKLLKTPERPGGPWVDVDQGDVARQKAEAGQGDARRDSHTLPGSLSLTNTGELAADVTLSQNRLRESRPSYLELPRRLTGLTDEMGRRSSVLLRDSFQKGDASQQASQLSNISEKTLPLSVSACEVLDSRELILLRAIVGANGPVPLSDIIPTATTSKRIAAAVFSKLLNLAKITFVEVAQDEAFGEIWVRARTPPNTSEHNTDALSSTRSIF